MRATISLLAMSATILLAACGDEPTQPGAGPGSAAPQISSVQSACKASTKSDDGGSLDALQSSVSGDSVTITHVDARYNCAEKVKLDASVAGNMIQVTEIITNPDDTKARCMCNYDLSVEIRGLAAGTYTASVADAAGTAVGTTTITVGVAPSLQVSSLQSACKGSPVGFSSTGGQLRATVQGGSLLVLHDDAIYNCASKLKMDASASGSGIIVQEVITNPGVVAYCMCTYDLTVELRGLAAGTYTVKVIDADGKLVGTLQATL
jgi:hypothetical protein